MLETRAETVTRSEEALTPCGLLGFFKETSELVPESCGSVPFMDTPGDVLVELVRVTAVLTVASREGLEVLVSNDFEAPG